MSSPTERYTYTREMWPTRGNLLNDQLGHSFSYDAENRSYSAGGVTYYYDGDGERIAKSSGKLYFFGTGSAPIMETDASGTLTAEYVFFNGKRVAMRKADGSVHYYFADQIGSANVVTNATGTMPPEQDIEYHPYGEQQVYADTLGQRYKFAGKERDSESGLDNFGARYNASTMGRFMSPDPLGGKLVDPQTLNKYAYVRNNPTTLTDPTGLYICADSKDGNNCTSAQDKAFEAARQNDLKSKDSDVVRAASAYGDPNVDNHVNVGFADLSKSNERGDTTSTLGADDKGNLFANSKVVIDSKASGDKLDEVVGHEGSHVADAQDLVKSITSDALGNFKVGQDITQYQSEQRAFHVSDSILRSENQSAQFNCGLSNCTLGTGLRMPGQATAEIDRILQNNYKSSVNNQPLTPANHGGSIVPH